MAEPLENVRNNVYASGHFLCPFHLNSREVNFFNIMNTKTHRSKLRLLALALAPVVAPTLATHKTLQ